MIYSRKHKLTNFFVQNKQFKQSLIISTTKKKKVGAVSGPKLGLIVAKNWWKWHFSGKLFYLLIDCPTAKIGLEGHMESRNEVGSLGPA